MCGIAGWVNFSESLKSNSKIIKKMTDILRGEDQIVKEYMKVKMYF